MFDDKLIMHQTRDRCCLDIFIITGFCPETASRVAFSLLGMLVGKENAEMVATEMGF